MLLKQRLWLLFLLIAILISSTYISCAGSPGNLENIRSKIYQKANPYAFNYLLWETNALSDLISKKYSGTIKDDRASQLCNQIETVLKEHNIPVFPECAVRLETPPHLLVISPRDKIAYFDRVLLKQDMSIEGKNRLESDIDSLGMVSLVENLGGLGAVYPPIVDAKGDIDFIVKASVEEWAHQYLAFRPLGFLYLLDSIGLRQNPDVITINETLAGMISDEIGDEVLKRFYSTNNNTSPTSNTVAQFNFNKEMRETRIKVDTLLEQGNIVNAEQYMEERRKVFVAYGYNIRKLNQAYFAFHGIYGDDPASISPVYQDMKELRKKASSLREFIDTATVMTSYNDLKKALQN